jgi:hypothetical protein
VVFGLEVHANTAVSTPATWTRYWERSNVLPAGYDGATSALIPMERVIPQVARTAVVIKDQRVRYADSRCPRAGG